MPRIAFVLNERELEFDAVRAQGAGGQNVNKVSTAIVLRFDVAASSLPDALKQRLLARSDQRIGSDGVVTIKAQEHRTQARNRAAALERLRALLDAAATIRDGARVAPQIVFGFYDATASLALPDNRSPGNTDPPQGEVRYPRRYRDPVADRVQIPG